MFDPGGVTILEAGQPLEMHTLVGEAIVGPRFRADIRRYHWRETVVSAGSTDCAHLHFFYGRRNLRAQSIYRECEGPETSLGEIVFIPPNHTLISRSLPGDQHVASLMFDPELVPSFKAIEWSTERLRRTLDIRAPQICSGMRKVIQEISTPGFASEIFVEGLLLQIVVELCRHFDAEKSVVRDGVARLSTKNMRTIVEHIEASSSTPSLDLLAQACCVSKRHFTRAFKNTTGFTVGAFIAERRLERAKNLLADRRILIKEVAYQCGFKSTPAFATAFRRATGLSPRDYRIQAL